MFIGLTRLDGICLWAFSYICFLTYRSWRTEKTVFFCFFTFSRLEPLCFCPAPASRPWFCLLLRFRPCVPPPHKKKKAFQWQRKPASWLNVDESTDIKATKTAPGAARTPVTVATPAGCSTPRKVALSAAGSCRDAARDSRLLLGHTTCPEPGAHSRVEDTLEWGSQCHAAPQHGWSSTLPPRINSLARDKQQHFRYWLSK